MGACTLSARLLELVHLRPSGPGTACLMLFAFVCLLDLKSGSVGLAGMLHYLHTEGRLDESFIREKFIGFYSDTFIDDVKQGEPTSHAFMGVDKLADEREGEIVHG